MGSYPEYLRATYSGKIYTPTQKDLDRCATDYNRDAKARFQHDKDFPGQARQLKPGEDVESRNGKVHVMQNMASVMGVNGLLTKVIFDKNPEHEFYVEESYPIHWMYPHLTPHGLIMKLHRPPLATLPPEAVAKDHEFWIQQVAEMIGYWLTPDTSVKEVCKFVEKVYVRKDLTTFLGDLAFVRSDNAPKMYSKLRSSIAGIYNWRIEHSGSSAEKQRIIERPISLFGRPSLSAPSAPKRSSATPTCSFRTSALMTRSSSLALPYGSIRPIPSFKT